MSGIQLLNSIAHREPDKLLIDDGVDHFTYRKFLSRAVGIGDCLRRNGVLPGARVPVVSKRHATHFVSLLGAWSIGAVAVPLDPSQLQKIFLPFVQQLSPRLALFDGAELPELGIECLSFDDIVDERAGNIEVANEAGVVFFTSGSTGTPKAVDLAAPVILGNGERTAKALRLTADDRILINTPPHYTSAMVHFLTLLSAGGGTIARSGFHFGISLWEEIDSQQCTGFGGAPAHLIRLFEANAPITLPSGFRFVMSSGDRLPVPLIENILARFPKIEIFTVYGLTEVGGRLCVLDPAALPARAGSVGKPIDDMIVTVRRDDGNEAAAGEAGHVFVRGPLLMRGYLNDAAATKDALTANGLRTGDLGYLDDDGFLWLAGREDDVFKSGAEKVSTTFVAETLLSSGWIADIAVIAEEDLLLGKVPHAYVVPGEGFDLMALKKFARTILPPSHIPKKWLVVGSIPRTGSGKVMRQELRRIRETTNTQL
jgi:acyl-CoA synthetase (AMP-forming)/AMP-acid ligase II